LIKDLLARCILGLTAEERRDRQDVLINIALSLDLAAAGKTDRVEDSVDYKVIKKHVLAIAEGSQYRLAEALAERIAAACLDESRVQQVKVTVEKPAALRFARSVAVEIVRRRS
jgi:dihydroneopterin aldolase/D-erythro-7,8-dihydroneopterin triphosphate epimerase